VSRLAELGAYLGAALMVASGAVVLGQQWNALNQPGQVELLLGLSLLLVAAGAIVVGLSRSRADTYSVTGQAILRRLSGTLLTLGAAAAAGGIVVAILPTSGEISESEVGRALVAASLVSLAILVAARIFSPSAFVEMALYAAVLGISGGVLLWTGSPSETAVKTTLFAVGLSWALLATFSRAFTVPPLATVLGLALAFFAANIGAGATSRDLFLSALVIVGVAVYLLRPSWPYVVVAMLSAVTLTVSLLGDAYGPAIALLAAGVVLLAFAGAVLLLQRRHRVVDVREAPAEDAKAK